MWVCPVTLRAYKYQINVMKSIWQNRIKSRSDLALRKIKYFTEVWGLDEEFIIDDKAYKGEFFKDKGGNM